MLSRLKQLRRETGISQQVLADFIGISQQSINHYENHDTEPDIAVLCRMAEYFDTSVDYLVGRTEIRRPMEETSFFHLNGEESSVVRRYRLLGKSEKACVDMLLNTFLNAKD